MRNRFLALVLALTLCLALALPALAVEYGAELNPNEKTYPQRFSDVPTDHWAFQYVGELVERGAINGYPDGKFYPDKIVTREEFAKIMVVAAGLTISPTQYSSYTDVEASYWASPFIEAAKPYMTAYQDTWGTSFRPKSGALREDIAVAVVRLKGYDTRLADLSLIQTMFSDVDGISAAARPYVALAVEHGIISGYVDGTFRGQATITRSEAAAMLWRAFQRGSDNKVIPTEPVPTVSASPTPSVKPTVSAKPTPSAIPSAAPEPSSVPTAAPSPAPSAPAQAPDGYVFIYSNRLAIDPQLGDDGVMLVPIVDTNSRLTTMRVTSALADAIASDSTALGANTQYLGHFFAIGEIDKNGVVSSLTPATLDTLTQIGDGTITLASDSFSYDSATKFISVSMGWTDGTQANNDLQVREEGIDEIAFKGAEVFSPNGFFNENDVNAENNDNGETYISVEAVVICPADSTVADYVYVLRTQW